MSAKKLKILFYALEADGHVNACIGLAQKLQSRGHTIIFVTNESFKQKVESYGFVPELTTDPNRDNSIDSTQHWANVMKRCKMISNLSSFDKMKSMIDTGFQRVPFELVKQNDAFMKLCFARQSPDIIIMDNLAHYPSIVFSGKPWIWLCSFNPLYLFNSDKLPPFTSGYPSDPKNGTQNDWNKYTLMLKNYFTELNREISEWHTSNGYPEVNTDRYIFDSPYLNLYNYPEELDYTDLITVPKKYLRFDRLMRLESGTFKLPEQLENKTGKLVYFSMGTLGPINLELMERLVSILAKSPHRFIVSKGPLHEKYELADNMYGERTLPQTLILPLVDLVITHGGNNTVTESFYFGKPMIVLPLFADQYDNAQRIHEKGFGVRLDPFNVTETEFLNAIENILSNEELKIKLEKASKRVQSSNSIEKTMQYIEELAYINNNTVN